MGPVFNNINNSRYGFVLLGYDFTLKISIKTFVLHKKRKSFFTRMLVIFRTSAENYDMVRSISNLSYIQTTKTQKNYTTESLTVSILSFCRHVEKEGCIESSHDTDVGDVKIKLSLKSTKVVFFFKPSGSPVFF